MRGLFGFMDMVGTYEQRKVDRYEKNGLIIDTAFVTDSDQPYETAVARPEQNNGDWVIVEAYDTKEEAQIGHDKWVKKMLSKKLPETLKDVSICESAKLCRMWGNP